MGLDEMIQRHIRKRQQFPHGTPSAIRVDWNSNGVGFLRREQGFT